MERAGYTVNKERSLFSLLDAELEYYEGIEETYERVKSEMENFRSFGDGLKQFMEKKAIAEISDPVRYLLDQCKENGVPIEDLPSARSMRAWYAPKKPRKNIKKDADSAKGIRSHQAQYARLDRSANGRLQMFAIAFALGLSQEETTELFHKIYMDRAFHPFVAEESIFYYCLQTGQNYATAKRLIEQLKMLIGIPEESGELPAEAVHASQSKPRRGELVASAFEESHGNSIDTAMLLSQIDECTNDDQLLECLRASAINFRRPYKKAIDTIKHYKTKISHDMAAEYSAWLSENSLRKNEAGRKNFDYIASKKLHNKKIKRFEKALDSLSGSEIPQFFYLNTVRVLLEDMKDQEIKNPEGNRLFTSKAIKVKLDGNEISFRSMFDILLTKPVFEDEQQAERLVPFNPALMAEVKRAFPGPDTLSKAQRRKATFDEMRKLIIFLFSVDYWREKNFYYDADDGKKHQTEDLSLLCDYTYRLDSLLEAAACPHLYYGNPYDFLFLYCTGTGEPLEALRMAIGDEEVFNPATAAEVVLDTGNDSIATEKQDDVSSETVASESEDDLLRFIFGN